MENQFFQLNRQKNEMYYFRFIHKKFSFSGESGAEKTLIATVVGVDFRVWILYNNIRKIQNAAIQT